MQLLSNLFKVCWRSKNADINCYKLGSLVFCNKVMLKSPKTWGKLWKIANIDREFLHIFWTTWKNSKKYSGKMCFKIVLKFTTKTGWHPLFRRYIFRKATEGLKLTPPLLPSRFRVKIVTKYLCVRIIYISNIFHI